MECVVGCRTKDGHAIRARAGYVTCDHCQDRLAEALSAIPSLYAATTSVLTPSTAGLGVRHAPGFGSSSPANDSVICLRDGRSKPIEDGDPVGVPGVLPAWAEWVSECCGVTHRPAATVPAAVEFLGRWSDWLHRQPEVAALHQAATTIRRQLMGAVLGGLPGPRPVGTCLTDGCGGAVYEAGDHVYVCRRCKTEWRDLPVLVTRGELAHLTGRSADTIRVRCTPYGHKPGTGRRAAIPLYDLAQASAQLADVPMRARAAA